MADVFQNLTNQIKNSKFVLIVGIFSFMMLLIGANHFVEDYYSSRYGLEDIEAHFGLIPVVFSWTYFTMSLTPQVAQIVFTYMFLSNTKKNKWAAVIAFIAFTVDFFADLWYRSDSNPFESWEKFCVTAIMTFSFFTVGSELFITAGGGLILELVSPFIRQLRLFLSDLKSGWSGSSQKVSSYGKINHKTVNVNDKKRHNVKNSVNDSKLTDKQRDIAKMSPKSLSKKYGVSERTAYRWKDGLADNVGK